MITKPRFQPTEDERKMVEALAGFGARQSDIAVLVRDGIDLKTLRKYFRHELDKGKAKANAKIGQSLYEQATSGNTTAAIFWAKTQMGWKEVNYVDVTKRNANELTDDELYSIAATGSAGDSEEEVGSRKLN